MSEIIKKSDALNVINAIDLHEDSNSFKALSHAYKDIALLPSVEAIPVEWIKKWMVDNDTGWGEMSYISPVKTMLEEWAERKEE